MAKLSEIRDPMQADLATLFPRVIKMSSEEKDSILENASSYFEASFPGEIPGFIARLRDLEYIDQFTTRAFMMRTGINPFPEINKKYFENLRVCAAIYYTEKLAPFSE